MDIYEELPDNVHFLKYYIMDLILMNETFKERCKVIFIIFFYRIFGIKNSI